MKAPIYIFPVVGALFLIIGLSEVFGLVSGEQSDGSKGSSWVAIAIGTVILVSFVVIRSLWSWSSKRFDYEPKESGSAGWDKE